MNDKDLANFIKENHISAKIVYLEEKTPTVESASEALGVSSEEIGKSILFIADGKPILVIANGTTRVGYKPLAKYLGMSRRKVKLASAEQVLALTGYQVGTVPPFGHISQILTILEDGVCSQEIIYAGGGSVQSLMQIPLKELIAVTGAEIVSLRN
jgi:prolyl-tRNA editing enzyme YbaK/EbsC (Cys-tRNA(Pro) deacylase)